jgi:hypothetical protein
MFQEISFSQSPAVSASGQRSKGILRIPLQNSAINLIQIAREGFIG